MNEYMISLSKCTRGNDLQREFTPWPANFHLQHKAHVAQACSRCTSGTATLWYFNMEQTLHETPECQVKRRHGMKMQRAWNNWVTIFHQNGDVSLRPQLAAPASALIASRWSFSYTRMSRIWVLSVCVWVLWHATLMIWKKILNIHRGLRWSVVIRVEV